MHCRYCQGLTVWTCLGFMWSGVSPSEVSSVLAFAVCMDWKTSVSEAIIYVMVIGLSVDYVIHLGHEPVLSAAAHTPARCRECPARRRRLPGVSRREPRGATNCLAGAVLFLALPCHSMRTGCNSWPGTCIQTNACPPAPKQSKHWR